MARYAYIRVSTDKQSYDQQVQDIKAYGIDLDTLDGITEEKMTSNKGYEDRAFNSLLKKCKSGDIIYAASTDRIGCDFFDMMKLMKEAHTAPHSQQKSMAARADSQIRLFHHREWTERRTEMHIRREPKGARHVQSERSCVSGGAGRQNPLDGGIKGCPVGTRTDSQRQITHTYTGRVQRNARTRSGELQHTRGETAFKGRTLQVVPRNESAGSIISTINL